MTDKIKEQFIKDVKDHEITIVCDDGNTRYIRYSRPDDITFSFSLTTWDNHLCISGDMGDYVFCRISDMFNFFRGSNLTINKSYWHEKLVADSRHFPSMEFSSDLLEDDLTQQLKDYCEDNGLDKEFYKNVLDELEYYVLDSSDEDIAVRQINSLYSGDENIDEFFEYLKDEIYAIDFKDYSYHFIWCLYAIVWGIAKYDEVTK